MEQQLQQQPSSPTKLASVAIEAGTSSGSGGILSSAAVAPLNPILSTTVSYMYTGKSIIIPYSQKCWREFNLAVWYGIAIHIHVLYASTVLALIFEHSNSLNGKFK